MQRSPTKTAEAMARSVHPPPQQAARAVSLHAVETTVASSGHDRRRHAVGEDGPASCSSSPFHPALKLQRAIGNQAVGRLLRSRSIQAKLQISQPGDLYEQEADRIAERVVQGEGVGHTSDTAVRSIQRGDAVTSESQDASPLVGEVLHSSGQPLDPATRAYMEPRFGYDFSQVRVHSGAAAEESAREVNANAYTVGNNIVFGAGRFVPETHQGRRLLAHELSHVVQQRGGSRNLSEAQSSLSAVPIGYAQRQPQLPKFSQSTEEQIATLMQEHPGLSRVNAERAIIGPPGSIPTASGIPGTMGTGSAKMPKVPDIKFSQPTAKGSSTVLHREVKVWEGGQASFNDTLSKAADQLEAHGGGEVLVQVPKGTDARALVQKFKGAGKLPPQAQAQRLGRYRSIRITIVDPAGTELLAEPLEFPPSKILPSAGGGKGIAPVAPRAQGTYGEITTGEPTGVTASGGGERVAPVAPPAQGTHGEITVPQRGPVTPASGTARPVTSASGEIDLPQQIPKTVPEVKVPGGPSVAESAIKLAVTEIALNVLLFAVTYYLNKWHAEKQVRKFNSDLKGLLPEVNARLKNKEAEIVEKEKAFPLVYGNITIVYTHDKYEPEDYNEGSMRIQDVAISHQNFQTQERLIKAHDPISGNDPTYSLTFSVPLFEEKTAEKGASGLVRNYRQARAYLTDPAFKVRLSAVITLFKLAKQDSSLDTLVVRDLLGMLKDENALVRLAAATFLSRLKAKIAIQYIREVIRITGDDKQKELMQRYLHELEKG